MPRESETRDLNLEATSTSENPGSCEDWLLVDGKSDTISARDELTSDPKSATKHTEKHKKSTGKPTKLKEPLFPTEARVKPACEEITSSGEMSTNDQGEGGLQSTYDAIEDSLYKNIDKDTSTGGGKRVHTGNFRMKEKSEKVTTKDANLPATSGTSQ